MGRKCEEFDICERQVSKVHGSKAVESGRDSVLCERVCPQSFMSSQLPVEALEEFAVLQPLRLPNFIGIWLTNKNCMYLGCTIWVFRKCTM